MFFTFSLPGAKAPPHYISRKKSWVHPSWNRAKKWHTKASECFVILHLIPTKCVHGNQSACSQINSAPVLRYKGHYSVACNCNYIMDTRYCELGALVSQARLSLRRRKSGQIPIRLLYCVLSSSASNEVGVNINWDVFCKSRSFIITPRSLNNMPKKATAPLHSSLTQLTPQEILGLLETR